MEGTLSSSEREALGRFVAKLIDDVEKLAALYEARGIDASLPRAAQRDLQRTLDAMKQVERLEIQLQARVSEGL